MKANNQYDLDKFYVTWATAREAAFYKTDNHTLINPMLQSLAHEVSSTLSLGKRIFLCGNGGSHALACHIAAEWQNQLCAGRTSSKPAIALGTNPSTLSAIANDYDYKFVFSKELMGLAKSGDLLIALSTSGESPNVLSAIRTARSMDVTTALFTGSNYNKIAPMVGSETITDYIIVVPCSHTAITQEVHEDLLHMLVAMVDLLLYDVDYFDKETW